jgi:hypothetical protein
MSCSRVHSDKAHPATCSAAILLMFQTLLVYYYQFSLTIQNHIVSFPVIF